jgi:hypothetical protein
VDRRSAHVHLLPVLLNNVLDDAQALLSVHVFFNALVSLSNMHFLVVHLRSIRIIDVEILPLLILFVEVLETDLSPLGVGLASCLVGKAPFEHGVHLPVVLEFDDGDESVLFQRRLLVAELFVEGGLLGCAVGVEHGVFVDGALHGKEVVGSLARIVPSRVKCGLVRGTHHLLLVVVNDLCLAVSCDCVLLSGFSLDTGWR